MNYTKKDVGKPYFLHREKMLAKGVGPPAAKPRLHKRIVADGEEENQQREGYGEQYARVPFPQKQPRAVGQQCHDEEQKERLWRNYMRQYQDITTEQQDMVESFFPKKRAASREKQREQQNLEKEHIVGEQHRMAVW
jgi:transketolase